MYPTHIQRWMVGLGLIALVALIAQTLSEVITLDQKPNPFPHAPGLPTIKEDPFDPTRAYVDFNLLPWVMDPASAWPAVLRDKAAQPCGVLSVLQTRYPLWSPQSNKDPSNICNPQNSHTQHVQALQRAGWLDSAPPIEGPTLILTPEGDLILERSELWEMALTPTQGLLMRRREQP